MAKFLVLYNLNFFTKALKWCVDNNYENAIDVEGREWSIEELRHEVARRNNPLINSK